MKEFLPGPRRLGDICFRNGSVVDLHEIVPGESYNALVKVGDGEWDVLLDFEEDSGWDGACDCEAGGDCEHVFATVQALLAEHRAAKVQSLSSAQSPWKPEIVATPSGPEDLQSKLLAAVQRPLKPNETKLIRQIQRSFNRCKQTRSISSWDFADMGFGWGKNTWETPRIWPSFPKDEVEFWLYVAYELKNRGTPIPPELEPISDLRSIEGRMAKWLRDREVDRWNQILSGLESEALSPPDSSETDLRLAFGEKEARLQWRRPGAKEFENITANQMVSMLRNYGGHPPRFNAEASVLWQLVSSGMQAGGSAHLLRYADEDTRELLSSLVRMDFLSARLCDQEGNPLQRHTDALQWRVTAPENEQGDYEFHLARSDRKAAPEIWCVLPGTPVLFLTPEGLFPGPMASVLELSRPNRIPAAAIEREPGLHLLQLIGAEAPPRLKERIRTLPLELWIHCALQPIYPASQAEDVVVEVEARAPDGHREVWSTSGWIQQRKGARRERKKKEETITVYDRANLGDINSMLAPLNLKCDSYSGRMAARVTRKFPEVFAQWLQSLPPYVKLELQGELASFINSEVAGRVQLEVSEAEIDWFDLKVVLNVSDTTLSQAEIQLLLNAKGKFVRLEGKGWRRLKFDLMPEEDEKLAKLGISPREFSAEPQRLHALQLADEAAGSLLPENQAQDLRRRAAEIKARVNPPLPSGISADLRPYQLEGFHFLAYLSTNRFGGILADDMGLGKTLQTLAWLLWLRGSGAESGEKQVDAPSLVVCPKSVMDNWHAEAGKFAAGLRVKAWPAAEIARLPDGLGEADLHVINYNQLRGVGEKLLRTRWQAVILDEGQYIKNPNSQTAQIARSLRAEHRLVLTGTPIENRLLDLWSLMAFAMPGILGNRTQFGRLYEPKGDPLARRRLSARVRPFLLRRTKAQVADDLPERMEEDLFCEMEGDQQTLYRAELKRAQQLLLGIKTQKELASQQFHFLVSLLRLRQICCHPRLCQPDSKGPSAKVEALLEQLEPIMEEGQKVLVFSQFVEMLNLIRPLVEAKGWPVFYLAGDTENRGELVRKFQGTEGPAVFLISLKAGGFGLNLTAASYVVLFDPWWNPAVENQAIDRTHRIGQTNKVMAYRLLIKGSIEEKIRELQKQKKALAEDVLGEEKFSQSLSLDDLRFLFAD
jgi:hypothetical protein